MKIWVAATLRRLAPMAATAVIVATAQLGCLRPPIAPPATAGAAAAPVPSAAPSGGGPTRSVPYKWRNAVVLGGGFVTGIIFSPVEKGVVYARTDVGGSYRWNPAEKSWVPLNDDIGRDSNNAGIESIAADPVDENKVYMAVGMYTGSWVGNGALMRSNDRG
jgi:hypothetical protein